MSSHEVQKINDATLQQGKTVIEEPRKLTNAEKFITAAGDVAREALHTGTQRGLQAASNVLTEHREKHVSERSKITDHDPITSYRRAIRQIGIGWLKQEARMIQTIPIGEVVRRGISAFGLGVLQGITQSIHGKISSASIFNKRSIKPQ